MARGRPIGAKNRRRPTWETAVTVWIIGMFGMVLIISLLALPIPSLAIQIFYTNYAALGIGEPLSSFGWFMLSGGILFSVMGIVICAGIKSFWGLVLAAIGSFLLGLCIYAGIVNVLYAALSVV
jgi:hypothetical protein